MMDDTNNVPAGDMPVEPTAPEPTEPTEPTEPAMDPVAAPAEGETPAV